MEITKQYHTKINTTNVKSAYNVSTVTRSLSDTVKEAKLVLHSIEVKTETPESNNLKAEVLDAHTYRVTWQGKLDTELILLVNLTNANQVLTAEDDFENMELTNSITLEPRDLIRMVENGELFLDAEYQRGFVWTQEHKEEDEIEGDLVAILADETELVETLFEYGLIKAAEWVQVDFFEGVYFYEPTQELLDYMKELDEKYNN